MIELQDFDGILPKIIYNHFTKLEELRKTFAWSLGMILRKNWKNKSKI